MKKAWESLRDMFVFFAIAHIAILFYIAVTTKNFAFLNTFYVVSINLLFPGSENGGKNFIISTLFALVVFGFFYFRQKKKK